MNAAEKEAWIADLESGKYKHGKKRLMTIQDNGDVEHCCLGVLCETLGKRILPIALDHGDHHMGVSDKEFNRIELNGQEIGYEFFEDVLDMKPEHFAVLYSINDAEETEGFGRQIKWIRENVVAK
jgi:hypothetical protein